ncbi:MAG TPA: hypothetical protein VN030_04810 [Cellvibrio sp.]|nr:hypothetical protein [Cellvibrio sp.]
MKKLIAGICLCLFGSETYANEFTLKKVEIDNLGNYDGKVFFLALKENLKTDCAYAVLYCTAAFCKRTYSLVLAAKLANKKIYSVDYVQDPNTRYCRISNLKLNN